MFNKLFLITFALASVTIIPQDELFLLRSLNVDSLGTELKVYFTPGYRERAEYLVKLLGEAKQFFKDSLGADYNFSLAVLDEAQWNKIDSPFPYGLPWNNANKPYVIFMPADTSRGAVVDDLSNILERSDANIYVNSIGIHETGHTYVCEYIYGSRFTDAEIPFRWFDELMADYFCYAFLKNVYPQMADLIYDVAFRDYNTADYSYTSLQQFEEYYFEIAPPNYHWYQCAFIKRVIDVYNKSGISFISEVRNKISWNQNFTTKELLTKLEEISPGFLNWEATLIK